MLKFYLNVRMPRGQDRQVNAQDKALETLSNLVSTPEEEETEPVTPTAQVVTLPQPEAKAEDPKPTKKAAPVTESDSDFKKQPGEDFFEYVNRIPLEAFTANGAGLYVYKQAQSGNVQIDKIYRPLVFDELKNIYAAKNGAGNYYVQFNTRDKKYSSMGQRYTFDGDNLSLLGEGAGGQLGNAALANPQQSATAEAIKIIAEASREANKANIELIKDHAKKPEEGTAITALIIKMMDAQRVQDVERAERERKEAIARADQDRKDAQEIAKRDIDAAKERATRDGEFFKLLLDGNEKRANERAEMMALMQKQQTDFFNTLLKEKEKKEDSLGMGDVLKELFGAFARERLEGGGNDTLPGWAGVVQTALPKVADAVSTFMAVRAGASPQQVQALQTAQAQQNETAHGPNGGVTNPAPLPPILSADQQLLKFITWFGDYLSTHAEPKMDHVLDVINEEYGPIQDWIVRSQPDQIFTFIQNHQLGQQLLAIPGASEFISEAINQIKTEQGQEPAVIPATAQQYSVQEASSKPKKRKSAAN